MSKFCGQFLAFTGIILLLLLNFGKIVNGNCWEKKFLYKLPHSRNCGQCRICPSKIFNNPDVRDQHIQDGCKHNKPLQDGRLVHCHSIHFEAPSCVKPPSIDGHVKCTNDHTVYSICHVVCPSDKIISHPGNITCTSELRWDKPWPECVSSKHRKKLSIGACIIIGITCVTVFITIAIIIIQKLNRLPCERDVEYGDKEDKMTGNVSVMLTNGQLKNGENYEWKVKKGDLVRVEAVSNTSQVFYFVLLKTGIKQKKVFTSSANEPGAIEFRSKHSGTYDWIVGLRDGQREKGSFSINAVRTLQEPFVSSSRNDKVCDIDEEVSDEECEPVNSSSPQKMPDKDQSTNTDAEVFQGKCHGAGFANLMKSRQDVQRLCTLFDREYKDNAISWHQIAMSDLLQFDEDFVIFLEYHLKGKMFQGPMWYVLTLMRQRGVTLDEFVNYLQNQPASPKALEILQDYL